MRWQSFCPYSDFLYLQFQSCSVFEILYMAVIICTEKWPLPITYIGLYGTKILNEEVLLICSTVAASCSQPVFTQPLYCLSFNSTKISSSS